MIVDLQQRQESVQRGDRRYASSRGDIINELARKVDQELYLASKADGEELLADVREFSNNVGIKQDIKETVEDRVERGKRYVRGGDESAITRMKRQVPRTRDRDRQRRQATLFHEESA